MKKTLASLFAVSILSSCGVSHQVIQVGNINMVSTRNIENTEYVLLSSYMGGNKKEIANARAVTIEEAIDQTVKQTPGGEYLKNAKIYKVDGLYFAVEGDVWGIKNNDPSFRGLKVGDYAIYEQPTSGSKVVLHRGKITSLRDGKSAYLVEFGTNATFIAPFENLVKATFTLGEIEQFSVVKTNTSQQLPNVSELKVGDFVYFYEGLVFETKEEGTILKITGLDAEVKLKNGNTKVIKQSRLKLASLPTIKK